MKGTCKTCKHWVRHNEYEREYDNGLGRCGLVKMLWDCTEWKNDVEGRVLKKEYEHIKAFAKDASDCRAYLLTTPDFGCISHEGGPPH